MRLKNHTNIDPQLIRKLTHAVRPSGISNFTVVVKNYYGKRGSGRAYIRLNRVLVRIPVKEIDARYITHAHGGYLPWTSGSRAEVLVYILAHELRHLWQAKVKRGWRVYGSRGQFSERDASAYGLRMLRRYRRGELIPTPPPVTGNPQA